MTSRWQPLSLDDPRAAAGMEAQFRRRAAELESGARPVGWKVGLNAPPVQQLLGLDTCAVGYLTDAT